jgi:hypothetical protein
VSLEFAAQIRPLWERGEARSAWSERQELRQSDRVISGRPVSPRRMSALRRVSAAPSTSRWRRPDCALSPHPRYP